MIRCDIESREREKEEAGEVGEGGGGGGGGYVQIEFERLRILGRKISG